MDCSKIKLFPYTDFDENAKYKKNGTIQKNIFKVEKENSQQWYWSISDIEKCILNKSIEGRIKMQLLENIANIKTKLFVSMTDSQKPKASSIDVNMQIKEIENTLQRIHYALRKDNKRAMKIIINFLTEINVPVIINNIYSIIYSYSNVDMNIIQIISLLSVNSWYINHYKSDDIDAFTRKIKNCSFRGNINQFDFTKEIKFKMLFSLYFKANSKNFF